MHGRTSTVLALAGIVLACVAGAAPLRAADRPNVVVILADDLGYSDLGCYGGEIRTPHLDALARGGLRFTSFYNGGRCCPTRAALMTGLYPHQAGVGRMTRDEGTPGYRGFLTENTVTIPEALKAAGYRTGMVGKWHLSLTRAEPGHMRRLNNQQIGDAFSDPATYPTARGFDSFYGVIWGVVNFFDPFSLVRGAEPVREVPKDYYITDALTDEAVKFVDGGKPDQPFFLYVAHTAPHWPLHAREEDVERYRDANAGGWEPIRTARGKRMVEQGIVPGNHAMPLLTTKGLNADWSTNPNKDWDARAMAVHAAMVDRMDQGVGRLVAVLRERKQLDNTLILFLSDNGASPEVYPNPGFDRPSQTRDGRKLAYPPDKSAMPGREATFFYMGPQWASVANTPFRYWKAEMYEGGICTPMIAHWPKGLKAAAGSTTAAPGHVMDVMATCLDAAGAEYPKTFGGRTITPMEGRSLLPVLRGDGGAGGHEVLAWEHYGARAIRQGNMKLVARAGQPWELYDLSADRTETKDLAADRPEQVKALEERWKAWADRTQVFPVPERPAGKAKKAAS